MEEDRLKETGWTLAELNKNVDLVQLVYTPAGIWLFMG
jgi:hypothetical protein